MNSLVGYGSDDENETERYQSRRSSASGGGSSATRRRDDGDNYDAVNMDLSEEESEPELPPAEASREQRKERDMKHHKTQSDDSRPRTTSRERDRDRDRDRDRHKSRDSDSSRRSPLRDDRHRSERPSDRRDNSRRALLGDRPGPADRSDRSDRGHDRAGPRSGSGRPPAALDEPPAPHRSHDARDAVSPRFTERGDRRDRGDRERGDRDRDRDRDRHSRRSEEKRSGSSSRYSEERLRRETRPTASSSAVERRPSPPTAPSGPTSDYRPSYKVNKKLEVMEKMGLQIKTPDGSMATAQQLRAAASDRPQGNGASSGIFGNAGPHSARILDQVQKRKLLWAKKDKPEAEQASKWSGTRFSHDNDGKQVSKFMRLMGVKEPAAIKPEPVDATADPIKKQEELFQAMQAQYEVARATTHTMRGVGLGFQRGQF